ncbi:MAG: flagellar regulator YcgR PilZN domain-containing protein [Burkholderiaceae bacterium]
MQVHDYDRFQVDDGAEVLDLLRRSAAARAMCQVRAAGRPETYLSPLREIGDDGTPVLDPPRAPVIERALATGSIASIEVRLADCRVSFETRVAHLAPSGSKGVLRLERPSAVVRVQKRETVRVQVPEGTPLSLTLDASDPALTDVPMHELCVQGGLVWLAGCRERLDAGKVFEQARLALPDGSRWPLTLRVVHAGVVRRQAEGGDVRVGVQFVHTQPGFETAVGQLVGTIARGGAPTARG